MATVYARTHGIAWSLMRSWINVNVVPVITSLTSLNIIYQPATAVGNGQFVASTTGVALSEVIIVGESTPNGDMPIQWLVTQPEFQVPGSFNVPSGETGTVNWYTISEAMFAAYATMVNSNCGTSGGAFGIYAMTLPGKTANASMAYAFVFYTGTDFVWTMPTAINPAFVDGTYGAPPVIAPSFPSFVPSSGGGAAVTVVTALPVDTDVSVNYGQSIFSVETATITNP